MTENGVDTTFTYNDWVIPGLRIRLIAVLYWDDIDFKTEDPSATVFAYNTANELLSMMKNGAAAQTVTWQYRADGRLHKEAVGDNAAAMVFFWDATHCVAEEDKDGIADIISVQPKGAKAKPYQVKQVRGLIVRYKLVGVPLD